MNLKIIKQLLFLSIIMLNNLVIDTEYVSIYSIAYNQGLNRIAYVQWGGYSSEMILKYGIFNADR